MAKVGLYALGLVILLGVLTMGAGFVLWDSARDRHVEPTPVLAD
jgi:hypothetical protein